MIDLCARLPSFMLYLMRDDNLVRVILDPLIQEVELPAGMEVDGLGFVQLAYGSGLEPPITDLVIDDKGIRATLNFDNKPSPTFIPWISVAAIVDAQGFCWQNIPLLHVAHTRHQSSNEHSQMVH